MDREKLKAMQWSYSRVNSFTQCKLAWYNSYILKERGEQNFFAEHGVFIHSLLEKYARGEILPFLMADEYIENYTNNVIHKAPANKFVDLQSSYFNKGKDYLTQFNGFGDYEIIEAEKEVKFTVGEYKFIGYIDLLLKDTEGNLVILDHKSKSFKNSSKKEIAKYFDQLYFYSIPIKEQYGVYPDKLILNAFQENRYIEEYFDENKVSKITQWVLDTIEEIVNTEEFPGTYDQFFCDNLCNFRNNNCPCKETKKNLTNDK